ncbi:hypothetical protein, conserved [Eimeria acervulina]|uniref:Thrombospondin type 1 domain-containing protein n=1 Tax=Eimeria acervulina TaxID=5801 RepID=U6GBT5_EIMAC|nr:hypothetical protein, conserved [Eimeria acervulina]CDI76808.1 hypothetical protein, conserved [Eimeria acervulina]
MQPFQQQQLMQQQQQLMQHQQQHLVQQQQPQQHEGDVWGASDTQIESCNEESCGASECLYTPWGPWGPCSGRCGFGQQQRRRQQQQQPKGVVCKDLLLQVLPCRDTPSCSGCLLSSWSPWSGCGDCSSSSSSSRAIRQETRSRDILLLGDPCPPTVEHRIAAAAGVLCASAAAAAAEAAAAAAAANCPKGEWADWGPCRADCLRHRRRLLPAEAAAATAATAAAATAATAATGANCLREIEEGVCGPPCSPHNTAALSAAASSGGAAAASPSEAAAAAAANSQLLRGFAAGGEEERTRKAALLRGVLLGMAVAATLVTLFVVFKQKELRARAVLARVEEWAAEAGSSCNRGSNSSKNSSNSSNSSNDSQKQMEVEEDQPFWAGDELNDEMQQLNPTAAAAATAAAPAAAPPLASA